MNRISLIIKREYLSIVGRKSFLVMTILLPLLCVLGAGMPILLTQINFGDVKTVAVVDQGSGLGKVLKSTDEYKFVTADGMAKRNPARFYRDNDNDEIYAIVILPQNLASSQQLTIFSSKPVNTSLVGGIQSDLNTEITHRNVARLGVPDIQAKIDRCQARVNVAQVQCNDEGKKSNGSAEIAQAVGMVLAMVSYMFVLLYGAMIMNGVIEEKTNRIVEVIVSSCKPSELLIGKIVGVGLVGLTQLLIWGVLLIATAMAFGMGGLILGGSGASEAITAVSAMQGGAPVDADLAAIIGALASIDWIELILSFALYGIGGFLLFGSLFAAFGSAVDQPNDASQFTAPVIMIEMLSLWAGIACTQNPDGPLSMWCSMIPFTSPIVMMVRLPYSIPFWQLALSVVILYGTSYVFILLAARIYRRGILMYGKKASFADIFRWIK